MNDENKNKDTIKYSKEEKDTEVIKYAIEIIALIILLFAVFSIIMPESSILIFLLLPVIYAVLRITHYKEESKIIKGYRLAMKYILIFILICLIGAGVCTVGLMISYR